MDIENISPPAPLPADLELGVDIVYAHKRGDASVFVYPWWQEFPTVQQERVLSHSIVVSTKTDGEKRSEKQCRDILTSFHIQLPCEREEDNLRTVLPTASIPFSQLTTTKE